MIRESPSAQFGSLKGRFDAVKQTLKFGQELLMFLPRPLNAFVRRQAKDLALGL